MGRVIDDHGHLGRAVKPVALRTYEPGSLPDPVQCAGCLIIVNDRTDGNPRLRLALSNGASWDFIAFLTDASAQAQPARPIDLSAMVTRAVADQLPTLVQPPLPMRVVSPPALASADQGRLLDALIVLTERVQDLEQRIEFAERYGATTDIQVEAA